MHIYSCSYTKEKCTEIAKAALTQQPQDSAADADYNKDLVGNALEINSSDEESQSQRPAEADKAASLPSPMRPLAVQALLEKAMANAHVDIVKAAETAKAEASSSADAIEPAKKKAKKAGSKGAAKDAASGNEADKKKNKPEAKGAAKAAASVVLTEAAGDNAAAKAAAKPAAAKPEPKPKVDHAEWMEKYGSRLVGLPEEVMPGEVHGAKTYTRKIPLDDKGTIGKIEASYIYIIVGAFPIYLRGVSVYTFIGL